MKQSRKQRWLAMVLAVSMVLQQAVLPAIAEDNYSTEPGTEAVTEAPETQAPEETKVPEPETKAQVQEETKPQETKATEPETKAPETSAVQAPEDSVQEAQDQGITAPTAQTPESDETVTSASDSAEAVTPSSETAVSESQPQEDNASDEPGTAETPAADDKEDAQQTTSESAQGGEKTDEAETEDGDEKASEQVSEDETETEIETEAPKTSFKYEDSRVLITATASEEAKLPQDAVLKARYIEPNSEEYNAAVAKAEAAFGGSTENIVKNYVLYDIYFEAEGERIEPEAGTVNVSVKFVSPVLGKEEGETVRNDVIHLPEEGSPEKLNCEVDVNADGEVSAVNFTTDSFSTFCLWKRYR